MGKDKTALNVKDVSVGYGAQPVVRDVNLDVAAGEFFGLMGLNGAGKTTLIKAILGLRDQEKGEISIFDISAGSKEAKRKFAYLPERFEPPWFLKGAEFVEFSLKIYGQKITRDEIALQAERLALDPAALNRRVQTYSKGMRQKLGLLATVLTNCPLLILDEPMSGLDPMARALVKDMLRTRRDDHGQSVFFSSHILADMDELCDRVALLHDGEINFVGTPAILKAQAKGESLERAFLNFIEAA